MPQMSSIDWLMMLVYFKIIYFLFLLNIYFLLKFNIIDKESVKKIWSFFKNKWY